MVAANRLKRALLSTPERWCNGHGWHRYLPQSDDGPCRHKLGGTAEFLRPYVYRGGFFILREEKGMKIMLEEQLCDEAMQVLQASVAEVVCDPNLDGVGDADAVILTGRNAVPDALYDESTPLRVVGCLRANNANFDLSRATRAGRMVLVPRYGEAASVAEYAMRAMLHMAREREDGAIELKGKTIGFLGFPPLAGEIAQRANAFGMKALCYDPELNRGRALLHNCERTNLVDLFVRSDFVLLVQPASDWSKGLIGKDEIQLLQKGAGLICLTDPQIFRWDELVMALDWEYLSHFAIDLPQNRAHLAREVKKYGVVTVGEAGNTREARLGNQVEMAQDVVAALGGAQVETAINVTRVHLANLREGVEWCNLAQTLGLFMGQRMKGLRGKCTITESGSVPCSESDAIVAAMLEGIAKGLGETTINRINAVLWAEENGFDLHIEKVPEAEDNRLHLEVETSDSYLQVAGTRSGGQAQIVQVDDYVVNAQPRAHLLLVPHINRPGLVGQIGTLLGEKNVNIAEMVLGHKPQDRTTALMWIHIEEPLDKSISEESRKLASVLNMEYIYLPN